MSKLKSQKSEVISILNAIAEQLDQQHGSRPGSLTEIWGVEAVAVTADDLRYRIESLKDVIESINLEEDSKIASTDGTDLIGQIMNDVKKQAVAIRDIYVPNLFSNVNAHKGIISTCSFIEFFFVDIQTQIGFPSLLSLNASAKKRYEKLLETAANIEKESSNINGKTKAIIEAYNIAEDLPATSSELKKAKSLVDMSLFDITANKKEAETALSSAKKVLADIQKASLESEDLIKKFKHKYAAFTSVGLAESFANRAKERKLSVQKWTFLLISSLAICGFIGAERFPLLLKTLSDKNDVVTVLINMFYGFLSMAPAIWLAWISSAQIGMNYRISEDYNYKSTLASSYEGFRSEAIRIDPYLEAKLFMIAMERLDEIPLRFVDPTIKNSPLHELISSDEFKKIIEGNEELKLRVITIIKGLKDIPKDMLEYIESLKK